MSNEKVTVTVPMRFDPDLLWSSIMGAGWESFEWWVKVDYRDGDWDKHCTLVVTSWGQDDEGDPEFWITSEITIDSITDALSSLVDNQLVMGDLATDNFDACSSDCVIQQAVYGEVVYG